MLDSDRNPAVLEELRPDVVMLGLNLSRLAPEEPIGNFTSAEPPGHTPKWQIGCKSFHVDGVSKIGCPG